MIAIGCDRYDIENPLYGAEADARRLFDALMKPVVGDYDAASSRLLLSPNLAEVRAAVRDVLLQPDSIDTLTIFFAGHGGVKAGTYYLLPRDASSGLLSATALSASELLSIVAEAGPLQTNIIIDACQAGGVSADIRALLRPEDLGATATPGVTVLAMAARNQAAMEVDAAGIGTNALLDCIEGRSFVSDNRATLDLLEIGTRVAEMLEADGEQAPVVWGLNLFGPRRFCRNPKFGSGALRASLGDWNDSGTRAVVEAAMPRLWKMWDGLAEPDWSPRKIVDEVGAILASLPTDDARSQLIERLTAACDLRASAAVDRLRPIEARAAILAAALRCSIGPPIAATINLLSLDWAEQAEILVKEATERLRNDRYALLSLSSGFSDLYVLPHRLLRIGGWAAAAHHIRASADPSATPDVLRDFLAVTLEQIPGALVALSDAQAAPLASIVSATAGTNANAECELLVGALFASASASTGLLASSHIEHDDILRFLIARVSCEGERIRSSLARPSELMTVILRAAHQLGLDDVVDPHLILFDGQDLNAYIPESYEGFADDMVRQGTNAGYGIGRDVFTIAELEAAWQDAPEPQSETRTLAILAALLFPDRTPWFLIPAAREK